MTGPISRVVNAVTTKQVTPTQVVNNALQNIESSNPTLNYMAQHCPESALKDAASNLGTGPLAGVPVLVKDLENVAGLPTRKGSLALADAPAETVDGTVVARLKAAGAIVVGITVVAGAIVVVGAQSIFAVVVVVAIAAPFGFCSCLIMPATFCGVLQPSAVFTARSATVVADASVVAGAVVVAGATEVVGATVVAFIGMHVEVRSLVFCGMHKAAFFVRGAASLLESEPPQALMARSAVAVRARALVRDEIFIAMV